MDQLTKIFLTLLITPALLAQAPPQQKPDIEARLAKFLERFPESDVDKDGTLTIDEVRAFNQQRRGGQDQPARQRPQPTHPDVAYGEHEKQRFDLWPVPGATKPTPLAIYIHGGGFRGGDKAGVQPNTITTFHQAGVAFCSMNYRLSDAGPYPIMMHDAARGLQTIRHRAAEWNIDPDRIACYGGSAGAGISLWLAFHDDLADPKSDDPVARQSTRITAAATSGGQSTYDMHTYRQWFGVPDLKPHDALYPFYGIEDDTDLDSKRVKKLMADASPITHLDKDDTAPVYMTYGRGDVPVDANTNQSTWVHHVKLGIKLKEAMEKLGLECTVTAQGQATDGQDPYGDTQQFLIQKLQGAPPQATGPDKP